MLHETIGSRDPVALLVDAENISHSFAQALLAQAFEYGVPTVRRAYGKANSVEGWEEFGYRLMPTRPGRNSADLLLCAQAMTLALHESFHTLLIASSDGGFAYLVEQLRELGHEVIGLGGAQTPTHYRRTCTKFIELRLTEKVVETARAVLPSATPVKANVATLSPLEIHVRTILQAASGGLAVTELNGEMHRLFKAKIKETPEKTWRAFLTARPTHFKCDPKGPTAKVYLKS